MNGDIHRINLPAQNPEQIIFERRKDGFYNVVIKLLAIDPTKDEAKEVPVIEQFVAKLPDWVNGIPFDMLEQRDNSLYTVTFCESDN